METLNVTAWALKCSDSFGFEWLWIHFSYKSHITATEKFLKSAVEVILIVTVYSFRR